MTANGVRLRQVAVAALDGPRARDQLRTTFGLSGDYQDPGVAAFGLKNCVFALGDQFLELVSPCTEDAPVRRFLQRKGRSAAGYMVVLDVGAIAPYRERAQTLGLAVALESESETWGTLHLHPRTMGSLVSVDHDKGGDWVPAGPGWQRRSEASAVSGIASVRIATADPMATARRWAAFLDVPCSSAGTLSLRQGTIKFVPVTSGRDGLVAVDLLTSEERRAGERHMLAGTEFRMVDRPPNCGDAVLSSSL